MKVDRILLPLNNNKTYTGFWNGFAPVLKKRFNVIPTMIFLGSQEELYSNNFNTDCGDIIQIDPVESVILNKKLDWSVTWVMFWAAANKFPNDVCMSQGIDQLPLSNKFFNRLLNVNEDKFVIGFSDAYNNFDIGSGGYRYKSDFFFPSSHLVGKGKIWKKIFDIDDDWTIEIKKVFDYGKNINFNGDFWGLDENYASNKIHEYYTKIDKNEIEFFCNWANSFASKRISRDIHFNGVYPNFDSTKLELGEYSELHSPRPYETYQIGLSGLITCLLNSSN